VRYEGRHRRRPSANCFIRSFWSWTYSARRHFIWPLSAVPDREIARLTALIFDGSTYVNDVDGGDLRYFPTGVPHSIQGLGPDRCEFLLVFDDGLYSEDDTTLISDWAIHTPREALAKNWNVPKNELQLLNGIPSSGRYIFQAPVPGPLQQHLKAATQDGRAPTMAFNFSMLKMKPSKSSKSGELLIVDSSNFSASANIAAAHVIVKPGGLRELHWHPNADEWK
jgi:oxalate decarboxylase